MSPPIAIVWLPTAIGLAIPTVVLLWMWLRNELSKRRGSDDSDGSDEGGGGGGRRPPPGPPPVGPVSWPEFEREFADYVRTCSSVSTGADTRVAGASDGRSGTPRRRDRYARAVVRAGAREAARTRADCGACALAARGRRGRRCRPARTSSKR